MVEARYSIIVNVFDETGYAWTFVHFISSFFFFKNSFLHISFFLVSIKPLLYGQISDKTR